MNMYETNMQWLERTEVLWYDSFPQWESKYAEAKMLSANYNTNSDGEE